MPCDCVAGLAAQVFELVLRAKVIDLRQERVHARAGLVAIFECLVARREPSASGRAEKSLGSACSRSQAPAGERKQTMTVSTPWCCVPFSSLSPYGSQCSWPCAAAPEFSGGAGST